MIKLAVLVVLILVGSFVLGTYYLLKGGVNLLSRKFSEPSASGAMASLGAVLAGLGGGMLFKWVRNLATHGTAGKDA